MPPNNNTRKNNNASSTKLRWNKAYVRGKSLRNLVPNNILKQAGIHSTEKAKSGRFKTYKYNRQVKSNLNPINAEAVDYRKITNNWTPMKVSNVRLNEANSKLYANIYAASAPNYNTEHMVDLIFQQPISLNRQQKLAARVYALNEQNAKQNNYNSNNEELERYRQLIAKGNTQGAENLVRQSVA
jgi:hypothetical protein